MMAPETVGVIGMLSDQDRLPAVAIIFVKNMR
jgi:hypothetical protein